MHEISLTRQHMRSFLTNRHKNNAVQLRLIQWELYTLNYQKPYFTADQPLRALLPDQ